MTPTTKRGAVALADKTEDRIPSLAADLASLSPVARRKARKALVAIGKLSRAFTHSTPFASKAARAMGSSQGARAASPIRLPLPRWSMPWTTATATCVGLAAEGLAALGREGLQPLLAALLQRAESCWFCEGAHHVCRTLVKKRKLAPILRPVLAALKESEPGVAAPPAAYTALSRLRELS